MVARCEETLAVHGSGEPMKMKLRRIAEKARKEPGFKFTSLYHLMNEELLRGCFNRLRKDAGKPGRNGEHKHRPVASGEPDLHDSFLLRYDNVSDERLPLL